MVMLQQTDDLALDGTSLAQQAVNAGLLMNPLPINTIRQTPDMEAILVKAVKAERLAHT